MRRPTLLVLPLLFIACAAPGFPPPLLDPDVYYVPPRPMFTLATPAPIEVRRAMIQDGIRVVTTTVEVFVEWDGSVRDVTLLSGSGYWGADRAALDASRQLRFHPARVNGQAVNASYKMTYRFRALKAPPVADPRPRPRVASP